jgi:glutathione S-transferase
MKLYLAPGACSLADHIALNEAGLPFDRVLVNLKQKRTEDGEDFLRINPKGYVPTLMLDDGQVLTENIAILTWIGDRGAIPQPEGPLGRYRLLEMLAFISTELHKSFKPFFDPSADQEDKNRASATIDKRLSYIARQLKDDYLFGKAFTVADAYLFVMLTWARKNNLPIPEPLPGFIERMEARPAVREAMDREGLNAPEAKAQREGHGEAAQSPGV